MSVLPPTSGLIAMRIGQEFGPPGEFANALDAALARGGERGATVVALLDVGDLSIHIPSVDGPSWNTVPLLHLHPGDEPSGDAWAAANAILEKLERYR
jgi:hypothetical protein